jgi:uncharacterized membrane protein YdjX (TVP38/TMEM64 family)
MTRRRTEAAQYKNTVAPRKDRHHRAEPRGQASRHAPPHSARRRAAFRLAAFGSVLAALLALAAAWKWTPLGAYLAPAALVDWMRQLQQLPFAPLAVLCTYVLAGCVLPITLLIVLTGMAFEPGPAIAYALGGTLLSAAVTFLLGAWLGRNAVRRLAGARINGISQRLADGGIPAVALLRLFPLAPFTVVNMVAGASHIRLRDFLLGTLIGEGPGLVLMILFVHQLAGAIREPSLGAFSAAVAALVVLVWFAVALKRKLARKSGA